MVDTEKWIKRAGELLEGNYSTDDTSEQMQFATSMLAAFYGPESAQMKTFRDTADGILKRKDAQYYLQLQACATIRNVKAELEAGLVKNVRALITGENVAEFVALAREVLSQDSEATKNVAAVLVAAAFEDIMRRMGAEFAGVTGRQELQQVIATLKHKEVLKGGEPTTALGYLKFRNDSLHADWNNVERSQVHSCLAFVEQLLLKHLS